MYLLTYLHFHETFLQFSFFRHMDYGYFIKLTHSWHVFTNSESTNPRIFFHNFSCFLLKQDRVFFYWDKKMLQKLFIFTKKTLCSSFKRKQDIFCEKNWGFVDSEFWKLWKYATINLYLVKTQANGFTFYRASSERVFPHCVCCYMTG